MTEQTIQLKVILSGDMAKKFSAIKKKLGFENNTDVVRLLITRAYEQEQPYAETGN